MVDIHAVDLYGFALYDMVISYITQYGVMVGVHDSIYYTVSRSDEFFSSTCISLLICCAGDVYTVIFSYITARNSLPIFV